METILRILERAGGYRPTLYLRVENRPYMLLVVEAMPEPGPLGFPAISVAHYGEQNGDLMRDPELSYRTVFDVQFCGEQRIHSDPSCLVRDSWPTAARSRNVELLSALTSSPKNYVIVRVKSPVHSAPAMRGLRMISKPMRLLLTTLLHRPVGIEVGLVSSIPWICTLAAVCFQPRVADRFHKHRQLASLTLKISGCASFAFPNCGARMGLAILSLGAAGLIAVQPLFWTLPTGYLADRATAGGIAVIGMGNLGGFLAPNLKVWADKYFASQRLRHALRGAAFAGVALLLMAGITNWAGEHVEFINGQRQDVTSWGEHLWLRNRLSAYQAPLCLGSSVLAAALTSVFSIRRSREG